MNQSAFTLSQESAAGPGIASARGGLKPGRQEQENDWALGVLRSLEGEGRKEVAEFLTYLKRRQRGLKQSGFKELMQLRAKVGKLQSENAELLRVCQEMNEFRSVLAAEMLPAELDERRFLLLKAQIISMRRQIGFLQKTVTSQSSVVKKTRELVRYLSEVATLKPLQRMNLR